MSRSSGRHFLQIPGPTNTPLSILAAIAKPTIDHRGPEFASLGLDVRPPGRALGRQHW
jgi:alanine-glyoxylate transaminase / serine-glyoxylate transaminase / serine-pyruvate transaminase